MTSSQVLFKIIDVFCHPGQNYKKFPGITVEKDIPYGEHKSNSGDIYYDKKFGDEKYPVMLHIHGGGFVAGDKKHRKSLSSYYASKGWFVYNINYRLSPEHVFPEPIIDGVNALNKLLELEEKYNLDLSRVVVTGDSAGAYMASYLVCLMTTPALTEKIGAPEIKVPITGLMSFCGPYDLPKCMEYPLPFGLTRDIAKCLFGFDLDKKMSNYKEYKYIEEASPANFVNEKWPPTFLAMAGKDFFCKGQGEALEERLKELNVPVLSYRTEKFMDNHCFHLEFFKKHSKRCFAIANEFLDKAMDKSF